MSYFWPEGSEIQVDVDRQGRPVCIRWNGQAHAIEKVTRGWIVDDRWWIARIWRVYYLVITHTGLLLVVYRNLLTNGWYVERLYD